MPNVEDAIQTENHYFPAISLKWESAVRKKSFAKIPFAAVGTPETVCGIARRVGYINAQPDHLALYRLKLYTTKKNIMYTLPGWYTLENGRFSQMQNSESH